MNGSLPVSEDEATIVARPDGDGFDVVKNEFGAIGRYSPTQFDLLKKAHPDAKVHVAERGSP